MKHKQTEYGKGDLRRLEFENPPIYCEHNRFRDRCEKCRIVRKMKDKVYQVSVDIPIEKCKRNKTRRSRTI